jgi:putative hydrolase of the HAD superfamily
MTLSYSELGFDRKISVSLAKKTHKIYADERRYEVFPNTLETLKRLKNSGWINVVLSNHIPELPDIVGKLGFSEVIEACFSSAATGYEKPNIKAFECVLNYLNRPDFCVVIGDSVAADIEGANNAGIASILLRTKDPNGNYNECGGIDQIEERLKSFIVNSN